MVKISALVALFTMGSSILASPMVANSPIAAEQGLTTRQVEDGRVAGLISEDVLGSPGPKGGAAGDVAGLVTKVLDLIQGIQDDIELRKQFTQRTVQAVHARYPGHNIVVCNVGYKLEGPGWQSVTSVSLNTKIGRNVSFDVILFNSPKTFTRRGDGGFQNWAYMIGNNCQSNGGFLNCPAHRA